MKITQLAVTLGLQAGELVVSLVSHRGELYIMTNLGRFYHVQL